MFRQSCEPNCAVVFNDALACVVALRDIQEKEELTVCRMDCLVELADQVMVL